MAIVLHTGPDRDMATSYLVAALKTHKQAEIARHLGIDARTVRRWVVEQSVPAHYAFGLQRLLPLDLPVADDAPFTFIDLFAGIGGIRLAFEGLGGSASSPANGIATRSESIQAVFSNSCCADDRSNC